MLGFKVIDTHRNNLVIGYAESEDELEEIINDYLHSIIPVEDCEGDNGLDSDLKQDQYRHDYIEVKKVMIVEHSGYMVSGTAIIKLWGGGLGEIQMNDIIFNRDKKPTKKDIAQHANDGGFGCEYIKSCRYDLYEVYGNACRNYIESGHIELNGFKEAK